MSRRIVSVTNPTFLVGTLADIYSRMGVGMSGIPALRDVSKQGRERSGLFSSLFPHKKRRVALPTSQRSPSGRPEEWEMIRFESRVKG